MRKKLLESSVLFVSIIKWLFLASSCVGVIAGLSATGFLKALDDLFFIKGQLLSFVHMNHAVSAVSAIMMTAIAIIGLTYRTEKKRLFLAWDSIGIVLVFIINLMLLYTLR
jgi:hypothetical protein